MNPESNNERFKEKEIPFLHHIRDKNTLDISPIETIKKIIKPVDIEDIEKYKGKIKIIIFTAVEIEREAALEHMNPITKNNEILKVHIKFFTYYLGKIGKYDIILTQCNKGSIQRDGIILASQFAYNFWHPRIAILSGIAYGLKKGEQKKGDVLISQQIIPYDVQRFGKKIIFRGERLSSSLTLKDRFRNIEGWHYSLPNGKLAKLHFGNLISSERLIDNKKLVKRIKNEFPDAIGGEMEGAGFSASSEVSDIQWILIKGICDWAYKKKNDYQKIAANASISIIEHIFNNEYALKGF